MNFYLIEGLRSDGFCFVMSHCYICIFFPCISLQAFTPFLSIMLNFTHLEPSILMPWLKKFILELLVQIVFFFSSFRALIGHSCWIPHLLFILRFYFSVLFVRLLNFLTLSLLLEAEELFFPSSKDFDSFAGTIFLSFAWWM